MGDGRWSRAAALALTALLGLGVATAQVADRGAYGVEFLGTRVEFTPGNVQGSSPLTFASPSPAEGNVSAPGAVTPDRIVAMPALGGDPSGESLEGDDPELSVLVGTGDVSTPGTDGPPEGPADGPADSPAEAPLVPADDEGSLASLLMNDIKRIYGFSDENVSGMMIPWINDPGADERARRLRELVAAALEDHTSLDEVPTGMKARIAVAFHEVYSERVRRGEIQPRDFPPNHRILYLEEAIETVTPNMAARVNDQANSGLLLRSGPWGDGAGGRLRQGDEVLVLRRQVDEGGTPWYLVQKRGDPSAQGWVVGYWITD